MRESDATESLYFLEQGQALSHVGSWVSEIAGRVIWSREMYRVFGLPDGTPMTLEAFLDRVHPEDRSTVRARWSRAIGSGEAFESEYRIVRPNGEVRWVHSKATVDEVGRRILGVTQDVTDRRQFDDELRTERRSADELRTQLAAIVESSEDAICSMAPDGVVTTWNGGARRLFGYAADEMLGKPLATLMPEGRHGEVGEALVRVARGESVEFTETLRRRKDGTMVEVSVKISPLRDAAGRVTGAATIARDLTERRRAEAALHRSAEQLRQAQKMEAIGVLAGGIAHDFNNVLSIVLSYAELMLQRPPSPDVFREELTEIRIAGERAAGLTRQLLAFSRHQILAPRVIDINETVSNMTKMLRRLLGEHVDLALIPSPSACRVHADPGQIEPVLLNLIVNARDAMPEGGQVTVETSHVEVAEPAAQSDAGLGPGRYALVSVTDTGVGMDAATCAHAFEPFFTTKGEGRGTGLGLAMVFGIVRQSGGHVSVQSEPGRGSTFNVYLPRVELPLDSPVASGPPPAALHGTETILLAEDDEQMRTVMRTILRRHGYRVLDAQGGADAYFVAEKFGGAIDLLVTDMVMPRMGGRELADRLVMTRPELKILLVSGYTDDALPGHGAPEPRHRFLQKPITPTSLARAVRELLNAASPSRSPATR